MGKDNIVRIYKITVPATVEVRAEDQEDAIYTAQNLTDQNEYEFDWSTIDIEEVLV